MKRLLFLLLLSCSISYFYAQNLSDIAFFSTVKVQATHDALGNEVKGKLVLTAPKGTTTNVVTDIFFVKHSYKDGNPHHQPTHLYSLAYHDLGDKEYLGIDVWDDIYYNESDVAPNKHMDREIRLDDDAGQFLVYFMTSKTDWTDKTGMKFRETKEQRVKYPEVIKPFKSCPDDNHPHAIDLGLPSGTKWACCNVGADAPQGCGGFYAWGETKEKKDYNWVTYTHCDGTRATCHDIGKNIAGTKYDVAHMNWGDSWVMPSSNQISELNKESTCEDAIYYGVRGVRLTGKNGNSIFIPVVGVKEYEDDWGQTENGTGSQIVHNNYNAEFWSSEPSDNIGNNSISGLGLHSYENLETYNQRPSKFELNIAARCNGFTIRPVRK